MRIALFSDIHGNTPGLQAVLIHLDAQGGADQIFALGDLLGGGPGADEIVELLLERSTRMIRGNHEEMYIDIDAWFKRIPTQWRDWAQCTADWIQQYLSPLYWELLAGLPISETIELQPERRLFVCHAAPDDTWARMCAPDAPRELLQAAFGTIDANAVAYGHFHEHHVMWLDGKLLLNVASVGLRSDGLSSYTLLESLDGRWVVQQFQVPYDTVEEARLIQLRNVPLP